MHAKMGRVGGGGRETKGGMINRSMGVQGMLHEKQVAYFFLSRVVCIYFIMSTVQ